MFLYPRSWRDAWADAAYAIGGFWQTQRPSDHFRTSASTGPLLARLVAQLLATEPQIEAVIELGAGDGFLLAGLQQLRPDLRLTGIDLRAAPADLPRSIRWVQDQWDIYRERWLADSLDQLLAEHRVPTLLIACEWLDDLPCQPASRHEQEWRLMQVDHEGRDLLGDPPSARDREWLDNWWIAGEYAEIGTARDAAWRTAMAALHTTGGAGLVIDYGHLRADRPTTSTLTGYRRGQEVTPAPSPQMNLTAQVALDSVAAAGIEAGGRTEFLITQTEAVDRFLRQPDGPLPALDSLAGLSEASELQALRTRLGTHRWLLQTSRQCSPQRSEGSRDQDHHDRSQHTGQ